MNPAIIPLRFRRFALFLAWLALVGFAGWLFRPRYNVPEPPPRLDTQLPSASSPSH
jgi:hypothetical protein